VEQYQDLWCKGRTIQTGVRPCAERWWRLYEFLKPNPPETVLDLGANLGYYSMRMADQFGCKVDAVESLYYRQLVDAVRANGDDRVLPINTRIESVLLSDIYGPYDVVLALSVLHHLDMPFDIALGHLRELGRTVIVEIATEGEACGQNRVREQYIPDDAQYLGNVSSHLSGRGRDLFALLA
jgi:2-polyprenyl-3-methyl-5-hydroxy-6-metoxy-1,4-benzoquinol methylase